MTPASTGPSSATSSPPSLLGHPLPNPHPTPKLCRTTCSQTPGLGIGLSAAFYLQDSQGTPSSARERLPHFHELPPPATAPHPYCLIHRPGQPLSHHSNIQLMTKGYDPNSTTSRAAPFSLPHPSLSSLDHLS